ncbi:metabolite transporter (DMT) superfamily [Vibrio ponticus]|nr:metabolite transporter (DMT) superfamily [Vibrio ponticus]
MLASARVVTEQLGPIGGSALLYSVAALLLVLIVGVPKPSLFSLRYLLLGGSLFVCYEIFLALSLGFSNSRSQAIEVSIVNYLWPALTVLFSTLGSTKRPNILLYLQFCWHSSGLQSL